jgi:hypothetical protein
MLSVLGAFRSHEHFNFSSTVEVDGSQDAQIGSFPTFPLRTCIEGNDDIWAKGNKHPVMVRAQVVCVSVTYSPSSYY